MRLQVTVLIENLAAHETRERLGVTDAMHVAQVHAQVAAVVEQFTANLARVLRRHRLASTRQR